MYTVAFYTSILPIVLAWTMVGLVMIYFLDKYNILRRRTIKFALGDELSKEMTEMIELILPIYTLAADIFIYLITDHFGDFFTLFGLGLGVIDLFFTYLKNFILLLK